MAKLAEHTEDLLCENFTNTFQILGRKWNGLIIETLLISGLSGHGFKFAPVLGEIATQFAQGETPAFDLTPFSLARFQR